jgi:hypothetical protein
MKLHHREPALQNMTAAPRTLTIALVLGTLAIAGAEEVDPKFAHAFAQLICSTDMLKQMAPMIAVQKTMNAKKLNAEGVRYYESRKKEVWDRVGPAIVSALEAAGVSRADLARLNRNYGERAERVAEESRREAAKLCPESGGRGHAEIGVRLAIHFGAQR